MDLIYMNANKEDLGILQDFSLDLAFGSDENNFECRIQENAHCCEAGYFLYIEGTEYGGIIDSIEHNTESGEVIYSGRTWHGILNSKVIAPDAGYAYLTTSARADYIISFIVTRLNLAELFSVPNMSDVRLGGYKFPRYIAGYDGIRHMLNSVDRKLNAVFRGGSVELSSSEKHDYTAEEEFNSDQVSFQIKKNYRSVNHLICLGSGELVDRMVVHLYADGEGTVSQTQTFTGLDEYTEVFDYPNAESEEELIASGTARLRELWNQDELSIALDDTADNYDVGDIVGAYDIVTKTTIKAEIKKKIVTIKDGTVTISYEVGE